MHKCQRRTNVHINVWNQIDPSVLAFTACVIRMTALLQVSAVFLRKYVRMHECNNNFTFPSHSSIYTAILHIRCSIYNKVLRRCVINNITHPRRVAYMETWAKGGSKSPWRRCRTFWIHHWIPAEKENRNRSITVQWTVVWEVDHLVTKWND